MLRCLGCGLQFAEHHTGLGPQGEEIYSEAYFTGAIERRREREAVFSEMLGEIEALLGGRGKLLDVGAGEGTLLEVAASRGWDGEGTEVSPVMVEHMAKRELRVHRGELEDLGLAEGEFHAVVLNHVLEHVGNPRSTLAEVARILRPEGLVRVEVPNLASLSSRLKNVQSRLGLKSHPWRHYSLGHHFWFFTPATLEYTMKHAGLEPFLTAAPAKQWGKKTPVEKLFNRLYRKFLLGGHLVVYARRSRGIHGSGLDGQSKCSSPPRS